MRQETEEYAASRDEYPKFTDYVPVLLEQLAEQAKVVQRRLGRLSPEHGQGSALYVLINGGTRQMEVMQAISDRRSIRRFEDRQVSRELIEQILDAAIKAPSGKNRQPWRFFVLQGAKKHRIVDIMEQRIAAAKESGWNTGSAENSARIMRQAPVLILVFDSCWTPDEEGGVMDKVANLVDIQSIGAAIQNMLLAAVASGLGTLWICDILFGADGTAAFVGLKGGLVAAVALGYPAESPVPRPRKSREEVVTWVE